MKSNMKFNIAVILAIICFTSAKAQDPIFTQYFLVPQTLNPGFTGFMETANVGVIHRTQWPDLNFKVNTDYAYFNSYVQDMNSGIGVSFLSQRESFTDYSFSQVNVSYAYKVELDDEWMMRPAIEVGWGNKSYGFQNIVLEDQLNINTGVIDATSIDPLVLNEKRSFFDVSGGVLFNNENTWFGLGIKHLNRPNISFTQRGNLPLNMFWSVSGGHEFRIADKFNSGFLPFNTKLMVTANYMQQAHFNRLDLGTGLIFNQVFLGVTGVTNPARNNPNSHLLTSVNAFAGIQYTHFKIAYSYDFNTSGIGRTGGIHEISLTYHFDLEAKCFGCPDYE